MSVTEARRKLPELVKRASSEEGLRVLITVHGRVAAELRSCSPEPAPGAAARRLQELMSAQKPHRGKKHGISEEVSAHLSRRPKE